MFFGVPTPSDDLFLVHVPNYTDPGMSLRARDGGIQILGFGGSPAGNFGGAMTIELSTFIGDIEVRKCSAVIGMLQPITLPPMLNRFK